MQNRLSIAVIGTGISGLSAAWLLNQRHEVTVYERAERVGGHSNTVDVPDVNGAIPVDTGFIVYNEFNYPNLTALFALLQVPTKPSDMSFAVSLDQGAVEYAGTNLATLFAQKRNILRPRFWSMLADLRRFFHEAPADLRDLDESTTLGEYLDTRGYGRPFQEDHLLPMASAVWSAPAHTMRDYPAACFIRFHDNHGLLRFRDRPEWRTVAGGSRAYVKRLTESYADRIRLNTGAVAVRRVDDGVEIRDSAGGVQRYDHAVISTHADQALALLDHPTAQEQALLGAFRYSHNIAVLHSDPGLMPRRRAVWSSWNAVAPRDPALSGKVTVTYWMNRLQGLVSQNPLFVSLNPARPPHSGMLLRTETYHHPLFDRAAMAAQSRLWSLQGQDRLWYSGSYFGAGFHEDGLQAGLAVAEALGGVRRPWTVADESGRIHRTAPAQRPNELVT